MVGYGRKFEEWEKDFIYLVYPLFSNKEIAEYLNRWHNTIAKYGKRNNLKKMPLIFPGDVFGRWTTIKKRTKKNKRRDAETRWWCKCGCGNESWVLQASLLRGDSLSCGCFRRDMLLNGTDLIPGWFFGRVREGAIVRNIPFEITISDIEEIMIAQDHKCAMTKIPLKFWFGNIKESRGKCNVSVDRIDNNKGYVKGNIQLIFCSLNFMKGTFTQQYFTNLCHLVAKNTTYKEDKELLEGTKKEHPFKSPYSKTTKEIEIPDSKNIPLEIKN